MARHVYDHATGLPLDGSADETLAQVSRENVHDGSALAWRGSGEIWRHISDPDLAEAFRMQGYEVRSVWVE